MFDDREYQRTTPIRAPWQTRRTKLYLWDDCVAGARALERHIANEKGTGFIPYALDRGHLVR
jgi:hypothetical protein